MQSHRIVLPSARAIRHEQLHIDQETLFLPDYITMSEFISKLCIVKGYRFIDEDTRVLLLLEASEFEAFASLKIDRNFFTFTKNSSYIFKFFNEISAERYDIHALSNADLYGEYEEHITILIELYSRYKKLCDERKYLDRIFLPDLYEFNSSFASSHQNVTLKIDGHLTNFELELLEELCNYTKVTLHFITSRFNTKMQVKFESLGFALEVEYEYHLSLNTKEILSSTKIVKNREISCESFSESLLQVAFVKKKLYEFVKKGYRSENIAVVLPNESKAKLLKSFDTKANLNFAMGSSFRESQIYTQLSASIAAIDIGSKENESRVQRVGDTLLGEIIQSYYKDAKEIDFVLFLDALKPFIEDKKELKIYEEEIHSFSKLIPFMQEMKVKSLFNLFMQRLAARTLDDVRGGKVTVLGVLETRSVAFDAVIILDFDDKNVPKRSDKDMFLNSALRESAGLPTMSDRENLQKHYYEMLINNSKEVAIAYVNSSESGESRFLKQLGIKSKRVHDESAYANILFERSEQEPYLFEDKQIEYSFKDISLSSTRLNTYLTCKRKYYHKYLQKLQNHEIPKDMPQEHEIGTTVHTALKNLYLKQNSYSDARVLQRDLERELDDVCGMSELDEYLIAMQKKRLRGLVESDIARFSDGWVVAHAEESFEREYKGIKISGQIDRIDKKEDSLNVLDYKTGSYVLNSKNNFMESADFQLEFYYLLAKTLGEDVSVGYYDLKESKIVPEAFLEEKIERLGSHIKDLLALTHIETKQCEDTKPCLYCEYKILCGRD